jgi:Fe-S cluster biosynthesis and repair protein YggX
MEGLEAPPYPGPRGQDVYDNISRKAWGEWLALQTMLINEHRLNVREAETRTYLAEQMEKFFNNEATDRAEGYVPPED